MMIVIRYTFVLLFSIVFLVGCSPDQTSDKYSNNASNSEKQAKDKYDFRTVNWGMTIDQVKNLERDKLIKEEFKNDIYLLTFSTELVGEQFNLLYLFGKDKTLYGATYIKKFDSTDTACTQSYLLLEDALLTKYGHTEVHNQNESTEHIDSDLCVAIYKGQFINYFKQWEDDTQFVFLSLSKNKDDRNLVDLLLGYTSKKPSKILLDKL